MTICPASLPISRVSSQPSTQVDGDEGYRATDATRIPLRYFCPRKVIIAVVRYYRQAPD